VTGSPRAIKTQAQLVIRVYARWVRIPYVPPPRQILFISGKRGRGTTWSHKIFRKVRQPGKGKKLSRMNRCFSKIDVKDETGDYPDRLKTSTHGDRESQKEIGSQKYR
jgi:hypothetical protein